MLPVRTFACAFAAFLFLGFTGTSNASDIQSLDTLRKVVEDFVRQQTTQLPGRVHPTVGAIDPRLRLTACNKPEAFVPAGSRLWATRRWGSAALERRRGPFMSQ